LSALLLGAALVAGFGGAVPASAQARSVPFAVGEQFAYDVRFCAVKVGTARMAVLGRDTVRARDAWHVRFSLSGGTFFYQVDDAYESWMDVVTLNALRFVQDQDQGGRERLRTVEIIPERRVYREVHKQNRELPSVAEPLDDGSFLYFIRTVPLEVGRTYRFDRYFKPDRNPVAIRVLRRERVQVPAGIFSTIVIQPVIKTSGIFAEGGQAELWLTDDATRMMVQLKSRMSIGSLNLFLRSFRSGAPSATPAARASTR
ncbi:MAG: DUF3108 domain-containing protein, partial [Gemmatimonadota bacterium]